ncbi:TetR/AcrR family transcriptional regulator C-terminal domain-containing protein [Leptolyngbya sp. FACHB-16]|nr:TetR/AcrR family transcriptional regulator C-terminal domain-containing protein [Leptolyngbya sp. FACHB-16]
MINDVVFWPRFLVMNLEISEKEVEQVVSEAVQTFLARYKNKREKS